ncbi:glucosyl-dolichyl phosphate glucuronosyltransferase [Halomarina halobia]|uniref:Glucosyl-dolichyl phosphate glucuronosyltransferase n=1 Tax=Halomarina halobia TaxID=3033386 RepID=A0ABD6A5Z8_9EURY|nr:glucosyl-dolichyl phosphate glucuronosyltransferase [Halomarina sp. PSR21]
MRVSVVVCTHTTDRYPDLREAVESVLSGTYEDREVIVVSDGSEAVYERALDDYGDREDVRVHLQEPNAGLLAARNAGAAVAEGDVVAFIDDDALADERWLEELVAAYDAGGERACSDPGRGNPARDRVLAAGGKMVPEWVAGRPGFLPAEFYWLVGVTHRGFADGPGEVRNTFGSNISFRREVFDELGGFDTDIGGRRGDRHLQGGETELCARLRAEYGTGVYYTPDAVVAHKIFDYRTDPLWLVRRAFWQGYSKRGMEVFVPESTGEEGEFLGDLFTRFVPSRLRGLVADPSTERAAQLLALLVLTAAVGFGYLYGYVKWR